MSKDLDPVEQLQLLLKRQRSNRRRVLLALAAVLTTTVGVGLDSFRTLLQPEPEVRLLPLLLLVVVAACSIWLTVRLLRENDALQGEIKELAKKYGRVTPS